MAIARAHDWPYYNGQIAGWRQQAAVDYENSIYSVINATRWKPVKNETIEGIDVSFHIAQDEIHPNDKTRGVKKAIEWIKNWNVNLPIPALDVWMCPQVSGPDRNPPPGSTRQIQTVGMHVDAHANNFATVILSGSSIMDNPVLMKLQGALPVRKGSKSFVASSGKIRNRGIADYAAEATITHQRSTRVGAIMVHELGHIMHQLGAPARFWPLNCAVHDFGMNPDLKMNVSLYANTSLCEFVAEVFTAKVLGFVMTGASIAADYAMLGGPPTPSDKGR